MNLFIPKQCLEKKSGTIFCKIYNRNITCKFIGTGVNRNELLPKNTKGN